VNDWQSFLAGGLSALIDSQAGRPYSVPDPRYNTASGVAGQAQQTQALTSNPLVVGALVLVAGLVVFALVRR